MKTVPCTHCETGEARIPRTATSMVSTAVCLECARALETEHAASERDRNEAERAERAKNLSLKAIHRAHPAALRATVYDDHLRGLSRGAFILAPTPADVELVTYRALALAIPDRPSVARSIGGGAESLTLAAATRAGFEDVKRVRETFLSPVYTSVVVTHLGSGGFLNESRRHAEFTALADQVARSDQFLLLVASPPWPGAASWFGTAAHERFRGHLDDPIILPSR